MVEDEQAFLAVSRKILEYFRYTALESGLEQTAIDQCKTHPGPIHLLSTEMVMPRTDGLDLATRLSRLHSAMKILLAADYTAVTARARGLARSTCRHRSK